MASKPANPIGYNWGVELRRETGGFQLRNEQVRSNLATDGKYIYVNTFEGNIRAVDIKNGETLWKTSKSKNIRSSPILSGSTLIQLMGDGTIYGINLWLSNISKRHSIYTYKRRQFICFRIKRKEI